MALVALAATMSFSACSDDNKSTDAPNESGLGSHMAEDNVSMGDMSSSYDLPAPAPTTEKASQGLPDNTDRKPGYLDMAEQTTRKNKDVTQEAEKYFGE